MRATIGLHRCAVGLGLALLLAGCGGGSRREAALAIREVHVWPVPPLEAQQPAARSLAFAAGGELVALDNAGRVLVYGAGGGVQREWRMPEFSAGKPEGVLVLEDGHVVVCDTHYHRVVEFDGRGGIVRMFGREGRGPGEFIYPVAVTRDASTNLYVAEYGSNDRVQVFTREGQPLRAFGTFGTGPGAFQRPSGLVWHESRVYVADAFNNRIQVFTDQGRFLEILVTPPLRFPYDLRKGPEGALYAVEYGAGRVTKMTLEGRLIGRYGTSGSDVGQFATPWSLAVDGAGRILVADTGNRRIVELVP